MKPHDDMVVAFALALRGGGRDGERDADRRPRAGLSEPGHPSHLRLSARQRRRRAGALFRREAAADREPHRDRGEQVRRRRQHRHGICRKGEARRLHHLRPCRDRGRGQPASVQEAAHRCGQGDSNRGIDQPAALHAGRRRQEPLQDRRRAHRGDEARRATRRPTRPRRPPAPSWARSTRTSPGSRRSR